MLKLSDFYSEPIDGHLHLFDCSGTLARTDLSKLMTYRFGRCIGFADIAFERMHQYYGRGTSKMYRNYFDSYRGSDVILCTGIDEESVLSAWRDHRDRFSGFGELKCYDECKCGTLPFKRLEWTEKILDVADDERLPVLFHYDIKDSHDEDQFSMMLDRHKRAQIVLCHCGYPNERSSLDREIADRVSRMQKSHDNLWIDISYGGAVWLSSHMYDLDKLDLSRAYVGSDVNPISVRKISSGEDSDAPAAVIASYEISRMIESDMNIKKLYKI